MHFRDLCSWIMCWTSGNTELWWKVTKNHQACRIHPLMSLNNCTNFTLISLWVSSSRSQPKARTLFVFSPLFFLLAVFQSKDIGIQMHEELVKVTNELYTVSNTRRLLQIDPSHLISCLSSATSFSSLCLSEILFHLLSFYSLLSPFFFFVFSEIFVLSPLSLQAAERLLGYYFSL